MADESNDPPEDETLEEIARLRADPELQRLIAEVRGEVGDEAPEKVAKPAGRPAQPSERAEHEVVAMTPKGRRGIDEVARVIINRPRAQLERIAAETGIAVEEFDKLDTGDRAARTQVAMRVIERIDKEWSALPKTVTGTACATTTPREARAAMEGEGSGPRPGHNITGTLVTSGPPLATNAPSGTLVGMGAPPARADEEDSSAATPVPIDKPSPLGWTALAAVVVVIAAIVFISARGDESTVGEQGEQAESERVEGAGAPSAAVTSVEIESTSATPSAEPPAPASASAPPPAPTPKIAPPRPAAPPHPTAQPKAVPAQPTTTTKDPFGSLDN